jgi:hypothetical protein
MLRYPHVPLRRALVVSALALTALAAVGGSAGAYPGPDDDPDYSEPGWIYANPEADATLGLVAVDDCGNEIPYQPIGRAPKPVPPPEGCAVEEVVIAR